MWDQRMCVLDTMPENAVLTGTSCPSQGVQPVLNAVRRMRDTLAKG